MVTTSVKMWFTIPLLISSLCFDLATSSVVNITRETFEELVGNSPDPWLINFCSYRHKQCKNVITEFLEASKVLERYMKLGFVDVEEEIILAYTFGTANVPRVLLFGYDKSHPKDFEGFKTVKGFTTAGLKIVEEDINEQIKGRFVNEKTVHELDEYSLMKLLSTNTEHKDWCVVNYSSECHDCLKFADIFKPLAEYFKHSFNFGAIDVLKHSHDLEKYPQVRHYINENVVENYSGELTYESLKQWLMNTLSDPLVNQLTSRKVLEKTCENKKYCVLVSVPTLEKYNSTYRTNFIEELHQKAIQSKHLSLAWLWFENGEQIHLQRLINVTETSFPIYTVVHVKKMIYLQMKQYNMDHSDIVEKILGYITDETEFKGTIEVKEFPKIFKVTPWRGQIEEKLQIRTEL